MSLFSGSLLSCHPLPASFNNIIYSQRWQRGFDGDKRPCLATGDGRYCRVRTATRSQVDVILNKQVGANNGFYKRFMKLLWKLLVTVYSGTECSNPVCTDGYVCWGCLGTVTPCPHRALCSTAQHEKMENSPQLALYCAAALCVNTLLGSICFHFLPASRRRMLTGSVWTGR